MNKERNELKERKKEKKRKWERGREERKKFPADRVSCFSFARLIFVQKKKMRLCRQGKKERNVEGNGAWIDGRKEETMLEILSKKNAFLQITGPAGCGKTQFCIMLSILATLPLNKGGLESNVIYIDTEAAFSATR